VTTADELLAKLGSTDARERSVALDELSDRIEYGHPSREEVVRLLAAMLDLVGRERDRDVLESALHALATAACAGHAPLVSWEPLAAGLDRFEKDRQLLEYLIIILGASRDARWRATIQGYLGHAESSIREEAKRALEELDAGP
jgi:hypothetical protein